MIMYIISIWKYVCSLWWYYYYYYLISIWICGMLNSAWPKYICFLKPWCLTTLLATKLDKDYFYHLSLMSHCDQHGWTCGWWSSYGQLSALRRDTRITSRTTSLGVSHHLFQLTQETQIQYTFKLCEGLKAKPRNCEQGATDWMSKVLNCDDTASIFQNLQEENTSQREVEPSRYLFFPPMLNLMCQ